MLLITQTFVTFQGVQVSWGEVEAGLWDGDQILRVPLAGGVVHFSSVLLGPPNAVARQLLAQLFSTASPCLPSPEHFLIPSSGSSLSPLQAEKGANACSFRFSSWLCIRLAVFTQDSYEASERSTASRPGRGFCEPSPFDMYVCEDGAQRGQA